MSEPRKPPNIAVQVLDSVVVLFVKGLIAMTRLRARDPRRSPTNVVRPDPNQNVRVRGWRAVLEQWSPRKRVAWFAAVLFGIAAGGAVLWYGVHNWQG